MPTLAALVKAVGRDSGTLPGWATFTTLVGASERAQKIASWVDEAWTHIQNDERDWAWMQTEFTSALVIGQARYTATNFGVNARFGSWIADKPNLFPWSIYDTAIGLTDEGYISQIDYEDWYRMYGRGSQTNNRPICYAISPALEVCFGPIPSKAYAVRGMYVKSPQSLTVDADTPEMPVRFHNLIKWDAIRLLHLADGAQQDMLNSRAEYMDLRSELSREQLPMVRCGGDPVA